MTRTAITVLIAASSFASTSALAAAFAMVTDLKGEAWVLEGAKPPRKLSLLGYIESPAQIKVDPAGKLAVTYFSSGVQYSFAGPARVALDTAAAKVIEGQAAVFKKVTPEKAIGGGLTTEQWRRLQQAVIVMRAVRPSFSVVGPDDTVVLDSTPEFEWTVAPGAKGYRLVVYGADNNIVYEGTTQQNLLRVGTALQPGKHYRWKVDPLGVSRPSSPQGSFTVADEAIRERFVAMRQSAGGELPARTFYATSLEAQGYSHDARAEWKALARDYPEEAEIALRSR
jgi:hypothetical protein